MQLLPHSQDAWYRLIIFPDHNLYPYSELYKILVSACWIVPSMTVYLIALFNTKWYDVTRQCHLPENHHAPCCVFVQRINEYWSHSIALKKLSKIEPIVARGLYTQYNGFLSASIQYQWYPFKKPRKSLCVIWECEFFLRVLNSSPVKYSCIVLTTAYINSDY